MTLTWLGERLDTGGRNWIGRSRSSWVGGGFDSRGKSTSVLLQHRLDAGAGSFYISYSSVLKLFLALHAFFLPPTAYFAGEHIRSHGKNETEGARINHRCRRAQGPPTIYKSGMVSYGREVGETRFLITLFRRMRQEFIFLLMCFEATDFIPELVPSVSLIILATVHVPRRNASSGRAPSSCEIPLHFVSK